MGVGAFQPRVQRQQAGNPGLVEIDHELGLVRRPGAAGRFVRDDQMRVEDANMFEPRQRMVLARRIEQAGGQRGAGVLCAFVAGSGEAQPPFLRAHESQARPDQLDRRRRDDAAQQGGPAQPDRDFRRRDQGFASGAGYSRVDHPDVERALPAGPGQDRVVEVDPVRRIVFLERVLDVGRQEADGERPARQPPSADREGDGEGAEQGAGNVKNDSGRRFHSGTRGWRQRFLAITRSPLLVIQSIRSVAPGFPR